MQYSRIITQQIETDFFKGRAVLLLGARRVGKTTLIKELLKKRSVSIVSFNGDDPKDTDQLRQKSLTELQPLIEKYKIIFIDEAQKIPNIGNLAKLLIDFYGPKKQIVLTGSSTLNLLDNTAEPLTGRKFLYTLFPLSYAEIVALEGKKHFLDKLNLNLIYGFYPEIYTTVPISYKQRILEELTASYLYKDILEFQMVRNPQVLRDLLKALALQIGSQVSYNELSSLLGISKNTVIKYIDLLKKNFIILELPAFSRNKRREISHSRKIFFYDVGIRNAVLGDFRELDWRQDKGALWENFMIAERIKYLYYHRLRPKSFFWRTYDGAEIDYVEEYPDELLGFEFKYSSKKNRSQPPIKWSSYSNSTYKVINSANFFSFLERKI